jgi:hypothetical protein
MPYRDLSLIVSIIGLAPLILLSHPKRAHAEYAQVHCAKVGNDDTVRTIPPSLIAGAAKLFQEPAGEAAAHPGEIGRALRALAFARHRQWRGDPDFQARWFPIQQR